MVAERVVEHWRKQRVKLGPPASEHDLRLLEQRLGVPLPAELRTLYAAANGFKDYEADEHIVSFWSIERFLRENATMADARPRPGDVAFADVLICSSFIWLRPLAYQEVGVYVEEVQLELPTVRAFFDTYLSDPAQLNLEDLPSTAARQPLRHRPRIEKTPSMPPALRSTLPYLLVALLALLAGLPALRADFVFDDTAQVRQNPAVRELDLGKIFGQGYWANASESAERIDAGAELYRPLTTLSIASSYQLYGTSALGYRLENLALHALASVLVLVLLLSWGFAQRTACFAAALFAVLPIHAEVLGSIILRNELLAACAGAIALAAHARGRWLFAAAAALAALLAKESAIALPALAWLADRAGLRSAPTARGDAWRAYGALLGACAVALLLRVAVIGQLGLGDPKNLYFHEESGVAVWLTMARYATEHYLGATLLGWPLVFDFSPRSFATSNASDVLAWFLLLGWAALSAAALVALVKRRSHAAFAFLFFVVALGPTANLLTRIGILGANRLAYFPSLGMALLLAVLGEALLRRARGREKPLLLVAAVLVLGYGVRTASALGAFAHPYALYSSVLAHAPENALALGSRGLTCFQIGVGAEAPPAAESALPREQWLARSFEDLRQSLVVDPSRWRAALPNLVYAAFHTERARELAPLLDACLRRKEPGLAALLPPLDGTAASLARWANALQGFAARGSRERALTAVARVLGPWAELDGFDRLRADATTRAAQAERIAALRQLVRALAQDGDRFTAALAQSALAPAFDRAAARWAR